jgi:hypothetical protein
MSNRNCPLLKKILLQRQRSKSRIRPINTVSTSRKASVERVSYSIYNGSQTEGEVLSRPRRIGSGKGPPFSGYYFLVSYYRLQRKPLFVSIPFLIYRVSEIGKMRHARFIINHKLTTSFLSFKTPSNQSEKSLPLDSPLPPYGTNPSIIPTRTFDQNQSASSSSTPFGVLAVTLQPFSNKQNFLLNFTYCCSCRKKPATKHPRIGKLTIPKPHILFSLKKRSAR